MIPTFTGKSGMLKRRAKRVTRMTPFIDGKFQTLSVKAGFIPPWAPAVFSCRYAEKTHPFRSRAFLARADIGNAGDTDCGVIVAWGGGDSQKRRITVPVSGASAFSCPTALGAS